MKSCGLMENGCIFHQHSKPSSSGNAESICCICSVFGSLKVNKYSWIPWHWNDSRNILIILKELLANLHNFLKFREVYSYKIKNWEFYPVSSFLFWTFFYSLDHDFFFPCDWVLISMFRLHLAQTCPVPGVIRRKLLIHRFWLFQRQA